MTLAPQAFRIEGHFEAYVKFVKDHRRAEAEGQDPELVEFNPRTAVEEGLGDEETTPLDSEAAAPDEEGDVAGAAEDSDRDEYPDV